MAVVVNQSHLTQTKFSTPAKSRLLRNLVRHASAPASPRLTNDLTNAGEALDINKICSISSTQVRATASRSPYGLLTEPSLARSLASRLRRDRDNWRSLYLVQQQASTISRLKDECIKLRDRNVEDVSTGQTLCTRFQDLVIKYDNLVDQLHDALRTISRLKKSDRSKGKVQQRNLRLKAALQRCTSQATLPVQADEDFVATLQEALSLANDRIIELETKGEALVVVLKKRNGSSASENEEEMEEGVLEGGLVEAELVFRDVLEDESFKMQRENWASLLDE